MVRPSSTTFATRLSAAWRVYADPRMLLLAVLGFSSGLPMKLVYSTLSLWLVSAGINKTTVGLFTLVSLPYSLKFVWAPVIDRVNLPWLNTRLGRRRSWMLVTQVGLMLAIVALAMTDPYHDVRGTAIASVVVAFMSASQDVVIDAYRVELLEPREQGAGAAVAVFGYRVAMLVASAGALHVVEGFDGAAFLAQWRHGLHGTATYAFAVSRDAWSMTYLVMAGLVAIGIVASLVAPRLPDGAHRVAPGIGPALYDAVVEPFASFMRRPQWAAVLAFVVVFKLGDAYAGAMLNPLLMDLRFTLGEIAALRDTWGLFGSLGGAALGGVLIKAIGLRRGLWLALMLMMASNLMFTWQALAGHDTTLLVATIGAETITGGVGAAVFVAYLSSLTDREYTATQYALLSSAGALSRIVLSSGSGWFVELLGWPVYFVFTTFLSAPAVALLLLLGRSPMPDEVDS